MRIQSQAMKCGDPDCQHEWTGELLLDVSVDLFNHALKEQRCPKCGRHNVLLRM